ncbi:MAG TPA: DNA-3-methyladenine glycosylase [Saprospiraceae bacterium]|nr:DNA-3-methyladenine glycosylase [Saprospiraceae bacterium]
MTNSMLSASFYLRKDVEQLARALLGKHLHFRDMVVRIVETEAYRAPDDRACHAYGNKRTPRTETMFLPGGHAYIYLCYGIHHLFNIVTGPKDEAHAVLIRAVEPIKGLEKMRQKRNYPKKDQSLTNGPGKWTQALGLTTALDGQSLLTDELFLTKGETVSDSEILTSKRIGVDYAGECADRPWRFFLKDSDFVSKK